MLKTINQVDREWLEQCGTFSLGSSGRLLWGSDVWDGPELQETTSHVKLWRQSSQAEEAANEAAWRRVRVGGGKEWRSIRLVWQELRDHRKKVQDESQRQARPAGHLGPGSSCQDKQHAHCSLLSRSLTKREQMVSHSWKRKTGNISNHHMLLLKPTNTIIYIWKDEQVFSWSV